MDPAILQERLYELVVRTSTELPPDVLEALREARRAETSGTPACAALETIAANTVLAKEKKLPLCQDTGMPHFFISAPDGVLHRPVEEAACKAVARATADGLLRQNCVEVPSGRNTGNNLGYVSPVFHWETGEAQSSMEITLLLKGGGSENVGIQYSLPDSRLKAGRDLDGVRKCVLDAACQAQGKGCAPGIIGVAMGGDRSGGCEEAKHQLLRRIGQRSPMPEVAELETRLLAEVNQLGIGPMGLGGRTTALEVFIGCRTRHPASFFVTVCYNCWCCRRQTIRIEVK